MVKVLPATKVDDIFGKVVDQCFARLENCQGVLGSGFEKEHMEVSAKLPGIVGRGDSSGLILRRLRIQLKLPPTKTLTV